MPLGVEQAVRGVFNRARRGLYAGKYIRSGNNVSEDGKNKTRRMWLPNAHYVSLYSESLDRTLRLRVTKHALRTIDKYGGLDKYILSHTDEQLDSDVAAKLRTQIQAALQQRRQQQQQPAGFPVSPAAAVVLGAESA